MQRISDHRYAPLVPALVERFLTTIPQGRVEPWCRRFDGVVLLADVAGFTALAESLATRGPAGVEQLSALLNACFGRLADTIAAYGGDVVGFAGDAPVVIFEALPQDPVGGSAIERALACAHALQEAGTELVAAGEHALSIRVAVASGDLVELVVGGVADRWQWLVGGPPIEVLARALTIAKPGEVAVARGSAVDIAAPGLITRSPESWRLLRADSPADACRQFVPDSVAARLDEGQSAWAAELRRVTTMFVAIRAEDFGRHEALDRLQPIVASLQASVFDTDGSVNQLIVDDKGTTLVAGWGLPGHGHDNDPERAVRAASAIRAALAEAGVAFGVGVATGRVFCGWRGNERRREYALIGATVNLAARLASAAANDILTDSATRDDAANRVEFTDAGSAVIKGRASAVPTFRPTAGRTAVRKPVDAGSAAVTPVGRTAERRTLAEAVDALAGGRGATVFVQGEAGSGKSMLVAEAIGHAERVGVRVLRGAGTPVERATGYDGWRDVLEDLLDIPPDATPEARANALRQRLAGDPDLADRAPLLGPVLDVRMDDTPLTARMSAAVRADGARKILVGLIEAETANRPVLLVLDDGHWLGSLSWGAMASVVRQLPGLLLLCALRPMTDAPAEWSDLIGRPQSTLLDLGRLSDDEATELACRELGLEHLPATLQTLIRDKAAGHPLFVSEFVRWLRDTGTVTVTAGRCHFKDGEHALPANLPSSVEGVILGRLDRLPTTHQLTLRIASVLGQNFSLETLRALHPTQQNEGDLATELAECQALGFLEVASSGVAFHHALVRDVTYQLMPPTQRVGLHRDVADWYARSVPAEEQSDAELAYHREGAEQYPEALGHLSRAGERAWDAGAARETLRFLGRAVALTDRERLTVESVRRASWHRLSGQARVVLGDITGSRQDLHAALALLDTSFPTSSRDTSRQFAREAARQVLHIVFPRRRLRRPSEAERTRMTEVIRTLKALGDGAYFEADHLLYLTTGLASVNRAERAGIQSEATLGYAGVAYTASLLKLEPLARRWWRLAGEPDQAEARLALLLARSMSALQRAKWDEFDPLVDELVETATTLGDARYLDSGLVTQLLGRFQQGRLDESLASARALLESATTQSNEQHQLWALQAISSFLHQKGDRSNGLEHTRQAIRLLPSMSDQLTIAQHYAHRLELANLAGDLEAAVPLAAEVAARVRATPPASVGTLGPFLELARYGVSVWAQAIADGKSDVRALAREARWAGRQLGRYAFFFPFARPYHLVLEGRIQWLAGRRRKAARVWRRAERLARALGMPVVEAEAILCLGRYAHADTDAGAAHRARASTAYRQLGFVAAADAAMAVDTGRR